jgi:glyoxalase family protein
MTTQINGLHHVTALAADAQRNVDFYTQVLGMRLVKKTINFDAPDVYHLYYGDETGSPGTIMTFFPFGPRIARGRKGAGQLTYTAYAVPADALDFWMNRLTALHIPFAGPYSRFDEQYLRFEDYDGSGIELVAIAGDPRTGWYTTDVPNAVAIRGFHTVTLNEAAVDQTLALLTGPLQHRIVAEETDRFRLEAGIGGPGNYVDVLHSPNDVRPTQGAGSVHHVAFSTDSDVSQLAVQQALIEAGYQPTEVLDRQYFHSIYFREPGGILFEVATNPPGFSVDEPLATLGTELKLPAWYEPRREKLEAALPKLIVR